MRPLTAPPSADGLVRVASAVGVDEPLRLMRRLRGGLGAATHLLAAGDDRFVLKRYPRHKVATVEAECAALSVAGRSGLPVPTLLAADPVGVWFGRPALVMSRVPGRADLSPRNAQSYVADVADALARIHAVPMNEVGVLRTHGPSSWTISGPVQDGLLPRGLMEQVHAAIGGLSEIAANEGSTFCHGDFHPGNLLWRRGRLTGVIDWSQACTSVRWWELAYMRIELAVLTDWDVATDLQRQYQERVGLDSPHQARWDLFHVQTGHKWAHTWIDGWREQGRTDLDLEQVAKRFAAIASRLLNSL